MSASSHDRQADAALLASSRSGHRRPPRQKAPETYEEKLAQLEELRQAALHSAPEAEAKPQDITPGDEPGFKVWHQEKDLRHALDLARENHLPLPGTALVSQLFAALQNMGLGEEGTQALVKALEKLGSVEVGE